MLLFFHKVERNSAVTENIIKMLSVLQFFIQVFFQFDIVFDIVFAIVFDIEGEDFSWLTGQNC